MKRFTSLLLLLIFTIPAWSGEPMHDKTHVTQLIHKAIDFSDDGEFLDAVNLLTKAIIIEANNEQAYFERGMAYLELDRNADAIADFDRALKIDPQYSGALDWRARTLASLGDFQRAAEDQLKNLRDNPDGKYGAGVNPQSWAECAESFVSAGDHDKARELLEEYFALHVTKVDAYVSYQTAPMRLLSKLLIQKGEFERALEFSNKAYSSEHQVPADILAYALALEASAEIEDAKKISQEAMKINDQMPGLKQLHQRLAE